VASAPEEAAPTNGFTYLAVRVSELAASIVDSFWKFLALFTANGGSIPWSNGLTAFDQPVTTIDGATAVPVDVLRLARQASFGPTPQLVSRIAALGIPGWIEEQFRVRGSTYGDLVKWVPRNLCSTSPEPTCWQNNFSRTPVAARFYANAVLAPDQLRQRVAFSLSQIIVVSGLGADGTGGLASYQQIMLDNAFGNYRDILLKTMLNGYMGKYLSMADSSRNAPSENFAREFLQLFSMGPVELQSDGSPALSSSGLTKPNYSADDVRDIARALTGWTYARSSDRTDSSAADYSREMVNLRPSQYDNTVKSFLGVTVPAGASPLQSVNLVVDAAFNHPSTAPHISKILIQSLVTSNPSPAYVRRVSSVFENNGSGVRGDLKSVVRAILLDIEARDDAKASASNGKVRDPALVMISVARAIGLQTDGTAFVLRDAGLGQPVFQSPSVFNFYPFDYPLARSSGLVSPASKLLSAGNITNLQRMVFEWTMLGESSRGDWNFALGLPGETGTVPLWGGWEAIGTDPDRLVAVVNLLMLNNSATAAQKQALRAAALSITHTNVLTQARRRAQALLYIAASSPNFLVDR
jgi:uncharacterized protein (DUF1800 family)